MSSPFILAVDRQAVVTYQERFKALEAPSTPIVALDHHVCCFSQHVSYHACLESFTPSLILAQREQLEKNEQYQQVLPYLAFMQVGQDGVTRYATYQRVKGSGEARLLKGASIGFGGHIDLADVISIDHVPQILETVSLAMAREIEEEVRFLRVDRSSSAAIPPHKSIPVQEMMAELDIVPCMLIDDRSNDVGRVHLGVVFIAEIPSDIVIETNEAHQVMLGMYTQEELLGGLESLPNLENWSKIVAEFGELAYTQAIKFDPEQGIGGMVEGDIDGPNPAPVQDYPEDLTASQEAHLDKILSERAE